LSRVRVHIDLAACFLDVGSSYPGGAHVGNLYHFDAERKTSKGGAVRPLKGNVSWVQTVVRQVGFYLLGMLED
jgi:hypothetical protein